MIGRGFTIYMYNLYIYIYIVQYVKPLSIYKSVYMYTHNIHTYSETQLDVRPNLTRIMMGLDLIYSRIFQWV